MIVDAHCHAGPGVGFERAGAAAPVERHLERAARAGIDRTVIFPGFAADYTRANREVARLVARRPEVLLGFACVHASRDRGRVSSMLAEGRRLGLVGIKVHRRDARLTAEICEAARALRLPVLYDPMGEVEVPIEAARRYPDVDFVVPHLGSFDDQQWRSQLALLEPLRRLPNLFADTSGVRFFDVLVEALHRAGPGKLLFGSDGPWLHPGVELAKVRALGLAPEREALVLGGNLVRILGRAARLRRAMAGGRAREAA